MVQVVDPSNREADCSQQEIPPPWYTVDGGFSPQQGMRWPSAPDKLGPEGVFCNFHGMMEKAEPVSLETLAVT